MGSIRRMAFVQSGGFGMKEFMTVRYLIDELHRENIEQGYMRHVLHPRSKLKNWFNDSDIKVEESTKTLIQNIFKGK